MYSDKSKKHKLHRLKNEEVELSLFTASMILYVDSPVESTEKVVGLKNLIWQGLSIQGQYYKMQLYFYVLVTQSKSEIKKLHNIRKTKILKE